MFNFIRDYSGKGFTLMHHNLSEHFRKSSDGEWHGDYGSIIEKDWTTPSGYRTTLVRNPMESFLENFGAFFVVFCILTIFFNSVMESAMSGYLYSALVYLILAVLLCRRDSLWSAMGSFFFIGLSYYETGHSFLMGTVPSETLLSLGVLFIAFLAIVVVAFSQHDDRVIMAVSVMFVIVGMIGILFNIIMRAKDPFSPMDSSSWTIYIFLIFLVISIIGIAGSIVEFVKLMKDNTVKSSFQSFLIHEVASAIIVAVIMCIWQKVGAFIAGIILYVTLFAAGFILTNIKKNPYAAKSGMAFPVIVSILCVLWAQNVAPYEILCDLMGKWHCSFITEILARFGNNMRPLLHCAAEPIIRLIQLIPDCPLWLCNRGVPLQGILSFLVIEMIIMISIDISFSAQYRALMKK